SKLSQQAFSALNNIPYFYIFNADSSQADFGLAGTFGPVTSQTSQYPYLAVLEDLKTAAEEVNFNRFTIETEFMIRDLSDLDGDSEITDLRLFEDNNSDNIDDYEPEIKYYDQNQDNDYYDFYGAPEISEEPDTHIKRVTLRIYKKNRVIFEESQYISMEKFTGVPGQAGGAELKLVVASPTQNCAVYALQTTQQIDALNLSISKTYPSDVRAFHADYAYSLRISGETDPAANLDFRLDVATSTIKDVSTADIVGNFDFGAFYITPSLSEGEGVFWGQATKGSSYSPWTKREFIRDINPPEIQNNTPSGTVKTRQPYVSATILDNPVTAGRPTSGICEDVIGLFKDSIEVNTRYDSSTGLLEWIDPGTGLPPVLSTGEVYTMVLEAGDNAHYKVKTTWTFTCDINDPDNSAPSVAEKSPSGIAGSNPPTISCKVFDNQSGIVISDSVMKLDGITVVDSSNISNYFNHISNPVGGYISYTPSNPLTSGFHEVMVVVSHWADNPYDKKTTTQTWTFNVP
ncbi:MAG: hypothetical protein ACYSR1_06150, partial [Planctomycetota bacterium]